MRLCAVRQAFMVSSMVEVEEWMNCGRFREHWELEVLENMLTIRQVKRKGQWFHVTLESAMPCARCMRPSHQIGPNNWCI